MDEQIVALRWQQRFQGRKVRRRRATIGGLALCGVLSGCQSNSGPGSAELTPVAQFFTDHGGLSFDQNPKRPCLQAVDLDNTVVGGLFGGTSVTLINFIEQQGLATMTRTPDGTGRIEVVMTLQTPIKPTGSARPPMAVTATFALESFSSPKWTPFQKPSPPRLGATSHI